MMNCQQLADLLLEFLSGELEPDHHSAIEEHLVGCSSCVTFVETYRVTITLTRQLPPLPLREEFARRLEAMLKEVGDSAESG